MKFRVVIFIIVLIMSGCATLHPQKQIEEPEQGTTSASLSWDLNSPAPEGYKVYVRKDNEKFDFDNPRWKGNSSSCVITGLKYNTNYHIVVTAYKGDIESKPSKEEDLYISSGEDNEKSKTN